MDLDGKALVQRALHARKYAYAPYSGFQVGAALLLGDGEVIEGCNVENASYGLSMCAERTVIFRAISLGKRQFSALAVAVEALHVVTPCGACRQVMAEFMSPKTPVFLGNAAGAFQETTVDWLLPGAFRMDVH